MTGSRQKKAKAPSVTPAASSDEWDLYDDRPALTEEEIAQLLAAPNPGPDDTAYRRVMKYRDLVLMGLLYDTKARISELCHATVGDLRRMNTAEPELYIRFPKGKVRWRRLDSEAEAEEGWHVHRRNVRGVEEIWAGPTIYEPRYTSISPRTKQYLDLYLGLRKDGKDRSAPLLTSKHGGLTPRGARFVLREYAKQLGMTIKYRAQTDTDGEEQFRVAVSPHAFREAGERHQLDRGANAKAVAEETGHSVKTQQEFYNRVNRVSVRTAQRLTNPFYNGLPGETPPPAIATAAPAAPPPQQTPAPISSSASAGAILLSAPHATMQDAAGLQEFAVALGFALKRIATIESLYPLARGDVVIAGDAAVLGQGAAARLGALARLQQEGVRLFLLEAGGEVDLGSAEAKKRLAGWTKG